MINIDELFSSAFSEYNVGNIAKSLSICSEIITLNPSHTDALYLLGMIKSYVGEYDAAIEYFKKALEIFPSFADAHYAMGNALRGKGKLDHALMSYQTALRYRPDFADCYYTQGNIYEEKMMFDQAASSYMEAVRINPNHSHAYARLGFALYNRREFEEGIRYLEKTLQLNPEYDEAYTCLGMIYREKEMFDKAIGYFHRALEINPESAWIYTNIGVTLQHKGEQDEGNTYLHKAFEKNPNITNTHNTLGSLLLHDQQSLQKKINSLKKCTKKILIVVCTFNRKQITALSLRQTMRYKKAYCHLQVYDDHSTDYDDTFLNDYADEVIRLPEKMGIDDLRWYQFRRFMETDFDMLYLTDNDVIHDPSYLDKLEQLYAMGNGKLPVSLYNNIFLLQPRFILFYDNGIFIKSSAPGASMFYDRKMVELIVSFSKDIAHKLDYLPWDNRAVSCLRLPWITPETSYLEHFGAGGINNDNYERQRAVNPTDYLRQKRGLILEYLRDDNNIALSPDFDLV